MQYFLCLFACTCIVIVTYSQQLRVQDSTVLHKLPADARIFPNPAGNKLTVAVKNFEAGMLRVQMLDASGKTVRDDQRLLVNGTEELVMMFALPAGYYFLVLKQKGMVVRKGLTIK